MNTRHLFLCLMAVLALLTGEGCREAVSHSAPPLVMNKDCVARVHWLGKRRMGVEASAYYLMRLWALPGSKDLEARTLAKLTTAPSFFPAQSPMLNPQFAALFTQPLLKDILQEECYFEISQPTNQPAEMVLAIRLPEARTGFWRTNLAIIAQALTGLPATSLEGQRPGWTIKGRNHLIEMVSEGDWSFIGISQNDNPLLIETITRARRYVNPFSFRPGTNDWLEVDFDAARVVPILGLNWKIPTNAPVVSFGVGGDGGNVLTHGEVISPLEIHAAASSWNIPTDLVREPLVSFTAARGIAGSFTALDTALGLSAFSGSAQSPPNQIYFWSRADGPFNTFWAVPMIGARDRLREWTDEVILHGNPWLVAHGYVSFARMPDGNGLTWGNLNLIQPFLTARETNGSSFIYGGLVADVTSPTNSPARAEILQTLATQKDLVYYDWEDTGPRVEPWLFLGQMTRNISHRNQLPMDSAGATWLGQIKARLGDSTTEVTQTGPNRLAFWRKSTVGLTAPELHVLVDWLESPNFPLGTFSLDSAAPQPSKL